MLPEAGEGVGKGHEERNFWKGKENWGRWCLQLLVSPREVPHPLGLELAVPKLASLHAHSLSYHDLTQDCWLPPSSSYRQPPRSHCAQGCHGRRSASSHAEARRCMLWAPISLAHVCCVSQASKRHPLLLRWWPRRCGRPKWVSRGEQPITLHRWPHRPPTHPYIPSQAVCFDVDSTL